MHDITAQGHVQMYNLGFDWFLEKGYEEWDNFSSGDEQPVEEKGLDDDEGLDFNVMPRLVDQEGKELILVLLSWNENKHPWRPDKT